MSDAGASIYDFLSCIVEVLREVTKLLYFSFDERIAELLNGAINDWLVGLARLEDPLSERIERGLDTVARSCSKFDCEHRMSDAHGEVSTRTGIVEYEVDIFGLAFVVVCIVDGCGNTESSVGPIFNEWRSGMRVA